MQNKIKSTSLSSLTKISLKNVLSLLIASFLFACSSRNLQFSIVSTKDINFSSASQLIRGEKKVEGVNIKRIYFIFPMGYPSFQEATNNAISSAPGAIALSDGVIEESFWWIPYIYGQYKTKASGYPVYQDRLQNKSSSVPVKTKNPLSPRSSSVEKSKQPNL